MRGILIIKERPVYFRLACENVVKLSCVVVITELLMFFFVLLDFLKYVYAFTIIFLNMNN